MSAHPPTPAASTPTSGHPGGGSAHARPPVIAALTGIRAVAALWVFLRHFRHEIVDALGSGPITQFVIHISNAGYLGVDLFFILSGFILTYTHLDSMGRDWSWKTGLGFLWLRIARVWPLTVVVLLLFGVGFIVQGVVTGNAGNFDQADPGSFLLHATLTVGWFPAPLTWNGVDWSVSAEWLAYLTFAIGVVALVRFARVTRRRGKLLAVVALMMPIVIVGFAMQDDSILLFSPDGYVVDPAVLAVRVLTEFWAGAIVAVLLKPYLNPRSADGTREAAIETTPRFWRLPIPSLVALATVAVLVTIATHDPTRNLRAGQGEFYRGIDMIAPSESIVVLPLFILLIAALALCPRDPFARLLSTRPLLLGGRISFAFYLVHPLLIAAGVLAIDHFARGSAPVILVIGLATAAAAWAAAWVLWRLVEEPARKTMRAMLPRDIRV